MSASCLCAGCCCSEVIKCIKVFKSGQVIGLCELCLGEHTLGLMTCALHSCSKGAHVTVVKHAKATLILKTSPLCFFLVEFIVS